MLTDKIPFSVTLGICWLQSGPSLMVKDRTPLCGVMGTNREYTSSLVDMSIKFM